MRSPTIELGRLAGVLAVLRRVADRRELEHLVVAAERGRAIDDGVRADPGSGTDPHARADDGEGSDRDVVGNLGIRRDDRARIDQGLTSGATIIVAEQTSPPSTSATVVNFQMPRIARSNVAFSASWSPGTTGRRKRAPSMPTK